MNKDDWVWVGIRLFGIYLLVLAIIAVPDVVAAVSSYKTFSGMEVTPGSENEDLAIKMIEMWRTQGAKAITEVLLFLVCGLYFIRGGRFIHKIISRGNDT